MHKKSIMKTTSILTAALVLACTASAFSQDKSPNSAVVPPAPQDKALLQTIDLDVDGITVAQLAEFIQKRVEKPLNIVIEEPARKLVLPKMSFHGATIQTVLDKVVTLAPIRVATIPSSGTGAPVMVIKPVKQGEGKHPALAPAPLSLQNKALLQTVDLNAEGITVAGLVEFIHNRVKMPLNITINEPARKVVLPAMRLRNVTIQTLLNTIVTVAPVRVSTIPTKGSEPLQIVIKSVK